MYVRVCESARASRKTRGILISAIKSPRSSGCYREDAIFRAIFIPAYKRRPFARDRQTGEEKLC